MAEALNTGFVPVADDVLAGALIAHNVPLQTNLGDGGAFRPVSNIYSASHPARVNGRRVQGKTTYYFAGRTACGKFRTSDLVEAWRQLDGKRAGDPPTQALRQYNETVEKLRKPGLGEKERNRLEHEREFWVEMVGMQRVRASAEQVAELRRCTMDTRLVVPYATIPKGGKRSRYFPIEQSL